MYRAKYKYKKESITSHLSFTLWAIIRLRVVYEKLSVTDFYIDFYERFSLFIIFSLFVCFSWHVCEVADS